MCTAQVLVLSQAPKADLSVHACDQDVQARIPSNIGCLDVQDGYGGRPDGVTYEATLTLPSDEDPPAHLYPPEEPPPVCPESARAHSYIFSNQAQKTC